MKNCIVLLVSVWATSASIARAAEPGQWVNVTPAEIALTGKDNYGMQDVLVDPAHLNTLYAFTCRFGGWKSTDYGLTWKKVSADGGPLDQGKAWGEAIAPDGSYMLATLSGNTNVFKSTDGGVNWKCAATTIHPYNVDIESADKNHVIGTGHDETHLIESLDAGETWTDQGPMGGATTSCYVHFLLDGNTVLAVSADRPDAGSWRGAKRGGKWTWIRVSDQDHDHGSHQVLIDRAAKIIYHPGPAPGLGILKSTDNGLTWTSVSKEAADAIIATPSTIYACRSFPIQKPFEPHIQHAARSADTHWTADPKPAGMTNGAKCLAVTFDGKNYILVSGNWGGGLWRYVEPASGEPHAAVSPTTLKSERLHVLPVQATARREKAAGRYSDAAPPYSGKWTVISDAILAELGKTHPESRDTFARLTAGVAVDRTTGDIYLMANNIGICKSTDQGQSFALVSGKTVTGRFETACGIEVDPEGGRLMCFSIYGSSAYSGDGGATWLPSKQNHLDYGAVDWSDTGKALLAIGHESGGKLFLSLDAGSSWKLLGSNYWGAGLFDHNTLLSSVGKEGSGHDGFVRSTDGGQTWTKVSGEKLATPVMVEFKGVGYWLVESGLLASKDKGATWSLVGPTPKGACVGPMFGADALHMVVGVPDGIYQSSDGGKTWAFAVPLAPDMKIRPRGQWANYAWDPLNNIFYASQMSKPAYKFVAKPAK